jgi:hypothetical protein
VKDVLLAQLDLEGPNIAVAGMPGSFSLIHLTPKDIAAHAEAWAVATNANQQQQVSTVGSDLCWVP